MMSAGGFASLTSFFFCIADRVGGARLGGQNWFDFVSSM